ncbi:hypothetical protein, partial [Streptomyces spectabilis]|uniref:hypothetical protein n=1 Tax=Streptomyces spectabilis TaxID=68270 RepID=UPI0033FCCC5E
TEAPRRARRRATRAAAAPAAEAKAVEATEPHGTASYDGPFAADMRRTVLHGCSAIGGRKDALLLR